MFDEKLLETLRAIMTAIPFRQTASCYYFRNELEKLSRKEKSFTSFLSGVKVDDGSSKTCIIFPSAKVVVKWDSLKCTYGGETVREIKIYQKSVEAGLAHFFPATKYLMTLEDATLAVQEMVDYNCYHIPEDHQLLYNQITDTVKEKSMIRFQNFCDKAGNGYHRTIETTWAKSIISIYGKKQAKHLCQFIIAHSINDLRGANIGFKNRKPVLLDFSGFDDEW